MTDPETSQPTWPVPPPGPSQFRNLRLPLLVGLLSLALTGWLWHHENQAAEARMRADFDFSVRQSVSRIEERIASYEQLLRAARGLFEASDAVSREDFQSFVSALMGGSAASRVLDVMGGRMARRDFVPGIQARLHHKDFAILMDEAARLGAPLPVAAQVWQQLNALMATGGARDDTASLLRMLEAKEKTPC